MKTYNLIIIWSGGGTKLRAATSVGKTVAIIEKWELGGTCLNRGCIPSKMLIYPADLMTHIREDTKKFGISVNEPTIDFKKLITRVNRDIQKDSESIEPAYIKDPLVTLYKWHGRFVSDKIVEVNGEQLTAEKIYIATGSKPQIPNIEWLTNTPFFTSTEALKNTKQPKKMIVIGWWYIATELGHFYGATGTDMHFLVRSEMLKAEDKDIRAEFAKDFGKRYSLHYWVSPTKVAYKNETFYVSVSDKEWSESIMESDSLFVATGVIPNTDNLWLENTKISTNQRGYIEVDDHLETWAPGVYALGDVVGNYLFRHSVNFEGEYLAGQHYLGEEKSAIHYPPIPHAVFSYPQIAGIGVTEDELIKEWKQLWIDYVVGINHYKNSAMGSAILPKVGMVKIIAEKSSGKMLGAHIVGDRASDIIHMLIIYITQWATVQQMLREIIFIHPALSENIRNAGRKVMKEFY